MKQTFKHCVRSGGQTPFNFFENETELENLLKEAGFSNEGGGFLEVSTRGRGYKDLDSESEKYLIAYVSQVAQLSRQ
jgi:hypothetical protein